MQDNIAMNSEWSDNNNNEDEDDHYINFYFPELATSSINETLSETDSSSIIENTILRNNNEEPSKTLQNYDCFGDFNGKFIDECNSFLKEYLCNCITKTLGEALFMCLVLSHRHSLTMTTTIDILKMINLIFDKKCMLPDSKYKVSKYCEIEDTFKYHLYCPVCLKYLKMLTRIETGKKSICTCGSEIEESSTNAFITLNFHAQLKSLLENTNVKKSLKSRYRGRNNGSLQDICDGAMYKKLCKRNKPLNNMWNFSYTFNTDGCQAGNSNKVSIWPIYATLNELPYKMRSKYMMLLGIWVNKREPNMQIFLQPFVKEVNFLSTYGLQWQYDKNTIITSRIIPVCCYVDSVARPAMLNMKQFNGHYGCTFCEHPTEYVEGYRKYPVSTNIFPNRTNASIKQNMITAHATSIPIKGAKGPSPLMSLKYFDLVNGMVPDYMHSVLLGVTKQLTEMYFSYPGKKFYVGQPNMFEIINNRLLHIRPPKNITRQPRSLHEWSLWKASEWRSWLMWYSLVCLYGILPKK
ncbi:uncharacterized protein LOC105181603 isoform X2 [Harpegnathos saltator]|nr:uncharacterized protein LOC105181603 isoform X2 [Harpegnathos saltator]